MKKLVVMAALVLMALSGMAQKQIYIPEDLRDMDLNDTASQWCWQRSAQTENLIFFWEKGFGDDLQNPPSLDGHPMHFDLQNLKDRVEEFYVFYRDSLEWLRSQKRLSPQPLPMREASDYSQGVQGIQEERLSTPLPHREGLGGESSSKASRYKMMVMVMYSLDGTAYGGTYDDFIGALWVAPNRIQDRKLNCLAHELGHSFQLQIPADSVGEAWGGSGFYEMTSQWMLWQVNPDWVKDEQYHFDAFKTLTHKAYLSMENIYHSPYVIQWWSDLRGRTSIGELYREGRRGEDPVVTYKRLYGLSQQQFCDEMLRGYQHLVNFDFSHAQQETRPYACTFTCRLDTLKGGWMRPKDLPEEYGFNAIPLPVGRKTRVEVVGEHVRYGFVGVTTDGESVYGQLNTPVFKAPRGKQLQSLYLVVMGAPEEHQQLYSNPADGRPMRHGARRPAQFPYVFRVLK